MDVFGRRRAGLGRADQGGGLGMQGGEGLDAALPVAGRGAQFAQPLRTSSRTAAGQQPARLSAGG